MTISEPATRHTTLQEADAEANRQLTTLDGWRKFAAGPPSPPLLLTAAELAKLSPTERALYDDDRLDHHARMLVVATSFVEKTVVCGRRLVLLNRHAISARRGLMVSGLPGTGKTSAITQLGLAHELLDRARHPNVTDRIPVLYITVPPAATARMIAAEFARFLGLPVRGRSNMTDIIEAVVGVCTDTRTGLVLVDEIHNVSQVTRAGAEVSDTLKYFSERIPATFVYAGINLDTSELLTGTRGAQIAGRFTLVPTRPFPYGDEWKGLVATMEKTLLLHDHPPGSLVKLDRYLHKRADGMIGALSHAIRGAAIDAILSGTERVTKAGLDAIPLDHAAESSAPLHAKAYRC
ncbi:ATP/GTP-binding protein [Streptomyces sp. WAC05292]|uniref:ATP-binding protein n=1 Tax=Streptomyces sp. WAC05292 TaxID=2487418 RepID=UPI000F7459D1|nr:ATP-binding protein [Streptomyces sp. WAC05292]RSS89165.1 ATP/GTP-binding protein [Streptomyces sp. WAC05292]